VPELWLDVKAAVVRIRDEKKLSTGAAILELERLCSVGGVRSASVQNGVAFVFSSRKWQQGRLLDLEDGVLSATADEGAFYNVVINLPDLEFALRSGKAAKRVIRPSREKPFWEAADKVAITWLEDNGCPARGDGNQAELERYIAKWLVDHGHEASDATVRRHVARRISERRAELTAPGSLRS
jgi:hypothetical protein